MSDMIRFVSSLEEAVVRKHRFGTQGSPWEFNLRDILRWLTLSTSSTPLLPAGTYKDFVDMIFKQRFRTINDREEIETLFSQVINTCLPLRQYYFNLSDENLQIGFGKLARCRVFQHVLPPHSQSWKNHLSIMESLMICVQQNWPCLLVGPSGSGKTSLIQSLASLVGASLVEFSLNSDIDTMDLVGGYEQVDINRRASSFRARLKIFIQAWILSFEEFSSVPKEILRVFELLQSVILDSQMLQEIKELLCIAHSWSSSPELEIYIEEIAVILRESSRAERARFEWVDGVLVDALNQGKWLVLDNANLCSSSVLDRLNSLLEPNGVLIINEHHTPNGDAKLVKPHPNFRLFMTMDPRNGELSRAMRNRSIEIFVSPRSDIDKLTIANSHFDLEASMTRFSLVDETVAAESAIDESQLECLIETSLSHLTWMDLLLRQSWLSEVNKGLCYLSAEKLQILNSVGTKQTLLLEFNESKQMKFQQIDSNVSDVGDAQVSDLAILVLLNRVLIVQHLM